MDTSDFFYRGNYSVRTVRAIKYRIFDREVERTRFSRSSDQFNVNAILLSKNRISELFYSQ